MSKEASGLSLLRRTRLGGRGSPNRVVLIASSRRVRDRILPEEHSCARTAHPKGAQISSLAEEWAGSATTGDSLEQHELYVLGSDRFLLLYFANRYPQFASDLPLAN